MPATRAPRTKVQRLADQKAQKLRRSVAEQVRQARQDAGLSQRQLARAAGISNSTLRTLEEERHDPSVVIIARVAVALGYDPGFRLFAGTGPLVRDHIQTAMVSALLEERHRRWRPSMEVAVYRPVRGVIDVVLEDLEEPIVVACEAHSQVRRVEQQIRWHNVKADALAALHHQAGTPKEVSRLLLLRSTRAVRDITGMSRELFATAYPARHEEVLAGLRGARWPGSGILWCDVSDGIATILEHPPRGVRVGR